jgi:hypothetical protein
VAPGHEKALPAGNPKVLAIVGVFPLGETALATFLSLERFNMGVIIAAGSDILVILIHSKSSGSKSVGIGPANSFIEFDFHLVKTFGALVAVIIEFQIGIIHIGSSATNLIKITINSIQVFTFR